MKDTKLKQLLDASYEAQENSWLMHGYCGRHRIKSAAVLTIYDDEQAATIAQHLEPRIAGKTVIEIGGGFGLLSFHLSTMAERVFCIEANPVWANVYIEVLLKRKPKNVSYLFGAADEFAGLIKGDVALFCTHSGLQSMKEAAALFAPVVIDVYGEVFATCEPGAFDQQALALRATS